MLFGVLGSLVVQAEGREVSIGGRLSQRILAMLLVNPNRVVTVSRLEEAAWDAAPPATARRQVRNRMAELRGKLTRAGAIIETHDTGYRLRAGSDDIDMLKFDALVATARSTREHHRAVPLFRDALSLWRGPALDGLGDAGLAQEAEALEERRLAALIGCLDLELAAGEHVQVIPELHQYVAENPAHEGFVVRLMIALYRSGRQSEALEEYQQLRRRLVEDLGVEPGSQAQDVHRAILDGTLPPPAIRAATDLGSIAALEDSLGAVSIPRQLPRDVVAFTGRAVELAGLANLVSAAGRGELMALCAVHGAGGMGKSALVVHAAHRAVEQFPDGQLYVDLQGATAGVQPLAPVDVLGRFLRALGVPGRDIPVEVEDAAAQFRSVVAARRLLLVLDNARDAAQVAPLIPGTAGCAVLVTSRRTLTSLDGATHIQLGVLSAAEALIQLGQTAGQARVLAEPDDAADLARWCGYLPLALRIAGTRLAARPGMSVHLMAGRLADAQRRLDELELADIGVRASVTISHQELRDSDDPIDRLAAEAFLLLGLIDGADISLSAAARLLDQTDPLAEQVLDRLIDVHLLENPTPGRFRPHDLLRLYAREQAAVAFSPQQQTQAIVRLFGCYLGTAWRASDLIRPGDHRVSLADHRWRVDGLDLRDVSAALDWLEAERSNLVKAVRQAAETRGVPTPLAVQLALALYGFFRLRGYWRDATEVNQIAIALAVRTNDKPAEASARNDLGAALCQLGRYAQATECLNQAMEILRAADDRYGLAQCLSATGVVQQMIGDLDAALASYQQSLAIQKELGNVRGIAMSLGNIGPIHRRQGRYALALSCHREGLALFKDLGDRYGQAVGLAELGILHGQMGRLDEAQDCLRRSLFICREMGDRFGEANALMELGVIQRHRGQPREALAYQETALAICRELSRRDGQAVVLRELGLTHRELGRIAQARASWLVSCHIFEDLQSTDAQLVRDLLAALPETPGP